MQVRKAPLSLIGTILFDPAPDSAAALQAVKERGQQLVEGKVSSVPEAPQILGAAAQADGLCDLSRKLLDLYQSEQLPLAETESLLRQAGLKKTAEGEVAANYVHDFHMSYGSNGGFRGSYSTNTPGRTPLADFYALQKPQAGPGDPALVVVNYQRPGFVGPSLKGTQFDDKSSSKSLFFVPQLSQVKGLEGDLCADDEASKTRLEQVFNSLDQASPLQLHSFSRGYGRVGTSYSQSVRAHGQSQESQELSVAAGSAALHGMKQILQVSGAQVPAPAQVNPPTLSGRVLAGMAAGGAAAALGTTLSGIHPLLGYTLGALTIAGLGAFGHFNHRQDVRDFPLPDAGALAQRDQQRSQRGMQSGLLLGVAAVGSASAGALLGWPGVALAAGACAATEALLAITQPLNG